MKTVLLALFVGTFSVFGCSSGSSHAPGDASAAGAGDGSALGGADGSAAGNDAIAVGPDGSATGSDATAGGSDVSVSGSDVSVSGSDATAAVGSDGSAAGSDATAAVGSDGKVVGTDTTVAVASDGSVGGGDAAATGGPAGSFVFSCPETANHCRDHYCSGTCDAWVAGRQKACAQTSTVPCAMTGALATCTIKFDNAGAPGATWVDVYYKVSSSTELACKTAGGVYKTL